MAQEWLLDKIIPTKKRQDELDLNYLQDLISLQSSSSPSPFSPTPSIEPEKVNIVTPEEQDVLDQLMMEDFLYLLVLS